MSTSVSDILARIAAEEQAAEKGDVSAILAQVAAEEKAAYEPSFQEKYIDQPLARGLKAAGGMAELAGDIMDVGYYPIQQAYQLFKGGGMYNPFTEESPGDRFRKDVAKAEIPGLGYSLDYAARDRIDMDKQSSLYKAGLRVPEALMSGELIAGGPAMLVRALAGVGGSAAGRYIAEEKDVKNPWVRMGLELGGGILASSGNPIEIKNLVSKMSARWGQGNTAEKRIAVETVQDYLSRNLPEGKSADDVLKEIEDALASGVDGPMNALTDAPGAAALGHHSADPGAMAARVAAATDQVDSRLLGMAEPGADAARVTPTQRAAFDADMAAAPDVAARVTAPQRSVLTQAAKRAEDARAGVDATPPVHEVGEEIGKQLTVAREAATDARKKAWADIPRQPTTATRPIRSALDDALPAGEHARDAFISAHGKLWGQIQRVLKPETTLAGELIDVKISITKTIDDASQFGGASAFDKLVKTKLANAIDKAIAYI